MRKASKRSSIGRVLRRAAALFLATLTVWVLFLTANMGAAMEALRGLGESSAFVTAALQAELGKVFTTGGAAQDMNPWQRLVMSQTMFLSAGEEAVGTLLAGEENILPEQPVPVVTAPPASVEDHQEVPIVTAQSPEHIVERTLTVGNPENYASAAGVHIFNRTSKTLDVAAMAAAPISIELEEGDAPQVLIVHTHGTEAYTPDGTDVYAETDPSRTTDEQYNMIRVGEEMARIFREQGLNVIHDRTLYDYPAYSGSYDRSKAAVERYLKEYPTIQIVLDVHRDALIGTDGTVYKAVTTIDGVKTAQVLLVVGSDDGGFEHPKWKENLTLAIKIQQTLNALWPTLARPVTLRSSRFNQQLTPGSLLVEMGCHGNTLQEALAGARLFARAAGQVLLALKH